MDASARVIWLKSINRVMSAPEQRLEHALDPHERDRGVDDADQEDRPEGGADHELHDPAQAGGIGAQRHGRGAEHIDDRQRDGAEIDRDLRQFQALERAGCQPAQAGPALPDDQVVVQDIGEGQPEHRPREHSDEARPRRRRQGCPVRCQCVSPRLVPALGSSVRMKIVAVGTVVKMARLSSLSLRRGEIRALIENRTLGTACRSPAGVQRLQISEIARAGWTGPRTRRGASMRRGGSGRRCP